MDRGRLAQFEQYAEDNDSFGGVLADEDSGVDGDYDPFAMTASVNGIDVGTMSSSDVDDLTTSVRLSNAAVEADGGTPIVISDGPDGTVPEGYVYIRDPILSELSGGSGASSTGQTSVNATGSSGNAPTVGSNNADLIAKISNNINTLQGIANRLPADQRERLLRRIWGGTTGATTYTGLLSDFTEGSYRLAKLGLDAAGERALRKSLTSLYKGAVPTLKVAGAIGSAVDAAQLFVDIRDRDGLGFIQHSAGVASSLTSKINPAIGMAVSGFRYMWDDQSTRALEDISMMDKTSIDAANTRQNINIQIGLRNMKTWMGQLQDGP